MTESRPHILIVDDEEPQRRALCDVLEDQGYATTAAGSARDALATVRAGGVALLLTDLRMPGMDGIALLREAQQIDPHLAGIVMTGHGTIDNAVDAMKTGALDFITKPFRLANIIPVLTRALLMRDLRLEKAELHRRLEERTRELEIANRELEAFSYSISHDLRAPLRAVSGFATLLSRRQEILASTEARGFLDRIVAGAGRMSVMIDALLRFARTTRQPLAMDEIDVESIVRESIDLLRRQNEHRRVEISIGPLPVVKGDAVLLRQVFDNLLSNAFKFTARREEARIEIGAAPSGDEIVFHVRDNGVGFEPKHTDRLFQVFQRLHAESDFEGTGVGLSIVERIITRHGGRVRAEGASDKGATFFVSLPGSRTTGAPPRASGPASPRKPTRHADRAGRA